MRAGCAAFRDIAPELALGVAVGDERAAALDHLAGCDDCRRELARLTEAVDAVIQAAPEAEPPSGFEVRALAAFAEPEPGSGRSADAPPSGSRRLRPALVAAAAVLVALLAVVAAVQPWTGSTSGTGGETAASVLRTPSGEAVGSVALDQEPGRPSRLLLRLDAGAPTGTYRVQCDYESGGPYDAGALTVDADGTEWTTEVHVPTYDLQRVRLISTDGTQNLEADVS